ncbi:MAG: ABC transporter permease [Verrucomicrobiota bacterium]|nr:ABC transporter permease [Verrucomicrobiota bacterium]
MIRYIIRRVLFLVPMLFLISMLAFALVRVAPGGPFDKNRRPASPEVEKRLLAKYHLDKPLWRQYLHYLGGILQGDFGPSLKQRHHSVNDIIAEALPVSLVLGGLSFSLAMGIGIPLGFYTAIGKGKLFDYTGTFISILFICVPGLVLGPLLVMIFAIQLRWFPVGMLGSAWHLVLPVLTLGIYFSGRIARLMREGMLNVLYSEFIMTARSKGLSETRLLWKHAFPLAIAPVLSYSGPLLADLLTGSFVVETIFQIPGLGIHLVNSSLSRDYPVIVGLVILYAFLLMLLNLLVDVIHAWIDPRVQLA